jgi:hypothetical protein
MNYLQYAFYAINIYLEKIFVGEIPVRVNLAIWPRARKFGVSATLVLQLKAVAWFTLVPQALAGVRWNYVPSTVTTVT